MSSSYPIPRTALTTELSNAIAQVLEQHLAEPRKQIGLLDHRVTNVEQRLEKEGLTRSQHRSIQRAVGKKVQEIGKHMPDTKPQHFANIYGALKDKFNVGSYMDIPRDKFLLATDMISSYDGSGRNWWTD